MVLGVKKLSTAVATVRAHPDKYEKEFNTVVAFLTQYIYKKAPTPSVKVASKPTKQQNVVFLRERLS